MGSPPIARTALLCAVVALLLGAGAAAAAPAEAAAPDTPVIGCGPAGPRGIIARVRPGDCVMYSVGMGDAGYWSIRRMTWSSWGGRIAPARGTSVGRNPETGEVVRRPARLQARGLRRGCDGRRWYSRVRVTVGFGWATLRLATCPGPLPD
jgi:hypothetical protein